MRNDETRRVVWNDAYTGPSITPAIEGVRGVIDVTQGIIKRQPSVQRLGPVSRECRSLQ